MSSFSFVRRGKNMVLKHNNTSRECIYLNLINSKFLFGWSIILFSGGVGPCSRDERIFRTVSMKSPFRYRIEFDRSSWNLPILLFCLQVRHTHTHTHTRRTSLIVCRIYQAWVKTLDTMEAWPGGWVGHGCQMNTDSTPSELFNLVWYWGEWV